jgi:cytochrome c553
LGDGTQAADLPIGPAPIGAADLADSASPAEWYAVVTQGRMDRFMPPFASLNDVERWDLVAYSFSLSLTDEALGEGGAIYEEQCASCHGNSGEGGPSDPGLIGGETYSAYSRLELVDLIAGGVGEAMPAYADRLSELQLIRVATYIQSLSFTDRDPDDEDLLQQNAASVETGSPEESSALIFGSAINGATGEAVEEDLLITLHGFEGQQEILTETSELETDGEFRFDPVPAAPGQLFLVSMEYDGIRYASEVVHLADSGGEVELPLTVFPATNEPRSVRASRVHLLLDRPVEDRLRMVELWVLINEGEATVAPRDGIGGIEIPLPEGAENLRFEDSLLAERYNPTAAGFTLATPLRPGGDAAQVVFSVDLPSSKGELIQPLGVSVEAITILVAEGGPRIEGAAVIDVGPREAGGESFHQYDLGPLPAGEVLRLELRGQPLLSRLLPREGWGTWVVGGLALAAAVAAVLWWYRPWESSLAGHEAGQRRSRSERRRDLLRTIAELDEAFETGQIDLTVYERRRNDLKQQALETLADESD